MIDFGCIHNGLLRRVHAWFDVEKARDRGCLSKSRRDRDPRTGRMGRRAPAKPGCMQRTPAQTTPPLCLQTARCRHAGREQYAWQLIDWNA
jgi:hypothetical protein